ncbi:unnamed protein product [Strongylus vulgaris]|uniref:Uncharacterized protein n=1 Tax=Strongylus vulgaris TaxID=40348 RepID=A0A3P7LF30_STRVU|nr:unnamed protein product [Strongylus vulgaris]
MTFFYTLAGSHAFVEEVLLPYLSRSNATIAGVLVLDGVLHFNAFPATQSMPEGFEETFPTAARELFEHSHMGDFIQLIARVKRDDLLVQHFLTAFYRSIGVNNDWSFRPWLLLLGLPIDAIDSVEDLHRLHPYLFADHSSFFFQSNQDIDIPTIYITDTCRGQLFESWASIRTYAKEEQSCSGATMDWDHVAKKDLVNFICSHKVGCSCVSSG